MASVSGSHVVIDYQPALSTHALTLHDFANRTVHSRGENTFRFDGQATPFTTVVAF